MATQEQYNQIPADDLERIYLDVGNKVPIEKSKLKYDENMKEVRADIEQWFASLPKGSVAELPAI